jgi:hypothetical protein
LGNIFEKSDTISNEKRANRKKCCLKYSCNYCRIGV